VRVAWRGSVRARQRRRRLYAFAASLAAVAVLAGVLIVELAPAPQVATIARISHDLGVRAEKDGEWRVLHEPGTPVLAGTRLTLSPEGAAAFDLVGGGSLRVAGATALVLTAPRHIGLEAGTLYVDSGLGLQSARIEIETTVGTFTDIGTQFELTASANAVRLRVREGTVRLARADRPAELDGADGEELIVVRGGDVTKRSVSPSGDSWSWAESLAKAPPLDGRSAYDVLQWVARETGRKLSFADPDLELRVRNATLSAPPGELELPPMDVLQIAIGTLAGVDYALEEGILLIRRR
jgi:ferric-dicitrate binding protein FerR (iron transport regulator)